MIEPHKNGKPEIQIPHEHGDWDQGGYCNRLVLDGRGDAEVCGYQNSEETPEETTYREALTKAALPMDWEEQINQAGLVPTPEIRIERSRRHADIIVTMSRDGVTARAERRCDQSETPAELVAARNEAITQCAQDLVWMLS